MVMAEGSGIHQRQNVVTPDGCRFFGTPLEVKSVSPLLGLAGLSDCPGVMLSQVSGSSHWLPQNSVSPELPCQSAVTTSQLCSSYHKIAVARSCLFPPGDSPRWAAQPPGQGTSHTRALLMSPFQAEYHQVTPVNITGMVGCLFKLSNVGVIYYTQYITGAPGFEALLDHLLTSCLIFITSASFYPLL